MNKLLLTLLAPLFLITACSGRTGNGETEVMLETTLGNIRVKLYDDTPLHRDNFLKNVRDGKYDGVMWHRIIRSFMVQTGEQPEQANADTSTVDSSGWIPAEIRFPQHYHHRGALAAAREGDDVNPGRKSDHYQFYIVTGRTYTDDQIRELHYINKEKAVQRLYEQKAEAHAEELEKMRQARDKKGVSDLLEDLLDQAKWEVDENPPLEYNQEQKRVYRTQGGAPWLDREYTVFGEVVEGMKTVLALERVKTGENDRPRTDVRVIRAYVIE